MYDVAEKGASRSRATALGVLCAAMMMIILDETIVNVALATIQRDLGFSASGLAWVVNAYLISFGGLLLLAGRLGDLIGKKRVFLAGLTIFTGASLLCGLSRSATLLVTGRFVQGIGGALTSSVILAMIIGLFPDPADQARALGAFSFSAAAGGSVGLVVGGIVTQALSWHWIFILNVPVGMVTWLVARRTLDESPAQGLRSGADLGGAMLSIGGLMLAVSAIVGTAEHGWTSARTLATAGVALLLMIGFIRRQRLVSMPLLPLRVFHTGQLAGGSVVLALLVGGMFSFQFLTALYLQRVLGYGPSTVGLAVVPVAVGIAVMSLLVFPRLIARRGLRTVLLGGLTMVATGLGLLARLPVDATYLTDILPALTLLGIGFGIAMPALTSLAMSGVGDRDAGVASGIFNTTQQVSGALGLAAAASVAAARTSTTLGHGAELGHALTDGYTTAFTLAALLVTASLVAARLLLRGHLQLAAEQPSRSRLRPARSVLSSPVVSSRGLTGPSR